jgi:hypothetical protein
VAHAVAGGQSQLLLAQAPADARGRLDDALHAAGVSGLQASLGLSGVVGVITGFLVLGMIRRPEPVGSAEVPRVQPTVAIGGQAVLLGRVADETGAPLVGAVLTLLDSAGLVVARLASTGDGGFVLPTEPGDYVLAAWAGGHRPQAVPVVVAGGRHELTIPLRKDPAAEPSVAGPNGALSPPAGIAAPPSTRSRT